MSLRILSNSLGLYRPAFFYFEISKELNYENLLDRNNDYPNKLGTLIHEYVHFLQDISTTYGLMNISYSLGRLSGFIFMAFSNSSSEIVLPIKLNSIENAELSWDILERVLGDTEKQEWPYDKYDDFEISDIHLDTSLDEYSLANLYEDGRLNQFEPPAIEIRLLKNGIWEERTLNFGAMAIMESMASIIERHFYPEPSKNIQFIYLIVERLCYYLCPSFAKNIAHIASLCDVALMYENPGMILITTLKMIAIKNITFTDCYEVYSFVYAMFRPNYIVNYESNYKSCIMHLNNVIPLNSYFQDLNFFIVNSIKNSNQLRLNNYTFLIRLLEMDREDAKLYFFSLMKKMEIVAVIDNNYEVRSTFIDKNDTGCIFAFLALDSLFSAFNNNTKCKNWNICKCNNPHLIDARCDNKPWEKVSEANCCPFAVLWHTWQLDGKSIKIK